MKAQALLRLSTKQISVQKVQLKVPAKLRPTPRPPPTWTFPSFFVKLSSAPSPLRPRPLVIQQFQFSNTQIAKPCCKASSCVRASSPTTTPFCQVNHYPRPPWAQFGPPQFFPLFNDTHLKLPAAQQKELEVLTAAASYHSDHVQLLHECAVASGQPLFASLRDDANGVLTLLKKRINALTVMAAKGTAAGVYVAEATINPLANALDDPDSRAALQQYNTQ